MIDAGASSTADTAVRRPVLLVILDGFGFNSATEAEILTRVLRRLSEAEAMKLEALAAEAFAEAGGGAELTGEARVRLVVAPVLATVALNESYRKTEYEVLRRAYVRARASMAETASGKASLLELVNGLVAEEALTLRYAVWYARSPYLNSVRNDYPTVATQAAGLAAGYEDVTPAVQGNSETGHQQISNFTVAAQTPLEISTEISDGRFFQNPELMDCLSTVKARGSALVVCFLLSGERGNDGRVHSAWNHLEALLEAAFKRVGLLPSQMRIEAITDGRDCPPYSSVRRTGDQYGFLYKLQQLLQCYDAEESLAWVIGRSIAMDRDYEQTRTEKDFRMLVGGEGNRVDSLDAAIEAVKAFHETGLTDTAIPPLIVGPKPRVVAANDVFLDLNFRADRQRAKVASLLGARDFLEQEAQKKGQRWTFDWLNPPANLAVYCLSEYHPDFAAKYGAKVLYPIHPQEHNLLAILPEQSRKQRFRFRYLLTAESTKALHVGYFIRGRREEPVIADKEDRQIIPSYGAEYGVLTDDDYYKAPQMRAFALADLVVEALARREYDLIALNLANTDMVGHLMPKRWDAAERSIDLVDAALETIIPSAQRCGYDVVITADHGNVEDDDSSHTANDVLTTFVSPDDELALRYDPRERARLFDLPWSIVEIMGLTERIIPNLPAIPEKIREQGLVGRSLVRVRRKAPVAKDPLHSGGDARGRRASPSAHSRREPSG